MPAFGTAILPHYGGTAAAMGRGHEIGALSRDHNISDKLDAIPLKLNRRKQGPDGPKHGSISAVRVHEFVLSPAAT